MHGKGTGASQRSAQESGGGKLGGLWAMKGGEQAGVGGGKGGKGVRTSASQELDTERGIG